MSRKTIQTRGLEFVPSSFDEKANTIEVLYSTAARVDRGWCFEDLVVSEDAIDTSRMDSGSVYLIRDHSPYGDPVGRIIAHRIDGNKAYATVLLSTGSANASTVTDIRSGVIGSVSVGYIPETTVIDEADGEKPIHTVTRWTPIEISLTPIPADPGAKTRSLPTTTPTAKGKRTMAQTPKNRAKTTARKKPAVNAPEKRSVDELQTKVDELQVQLDAATEAGTEDEAATIAAEIEVIAAEIEEVAAEEVADEIAAEIDGDAEGDDDAEDQVAAERERFLAIQSIATRNNLPTRSVEDAVKSGISANRFRMIAKRHKIDNSPAPLAAGRATIQVDEAEKRSAAATNAVYSLLSGKRSADAGDFAGRGIAEIARASLGRSAARMGDRDVITAIMKRSGLHTSSDFSFTSAAGGAIERRVREIFEALEMPMEPLVRKTLVSDFRPVDTYSIGGAPALKETPEGGEYEAGTFLSESGSFSAKKFGRVVHMSMEAMVNDDLRLLDTALRGFAAQGVKLRNKLIRSAFDAKLADGRTLFHSTRGNVLNVALDVEGLSVARAAMRKVKGIDGDAMGLSMKFLVVGPDLETKAQQLISPITAAVTGQVNPFSGTLQLIVDPLMEGNEWIIAASPDYGDAIELADMRGYEGVQITEIEQPLIDGMSWKARTVAGAHPTGWRGFIKSTGGN